VMMMLWIGFGCVELWSVVEFGAFSYLLAF
jgi:hypothetical protein